MHRCLSPVSWHAGCEAVGIRVQGLGLPSPSTHSKTAKGNWALSSMYSGLKWGPNLYICAYSYIYRYPLNTVIPH